MVKNISMRQLLDYALVVTCFFGTVGFALGFTKHFNQPYGYYLPVFPNVLDSVFLVLAASYLTYRALRKKS